MQPENMTSDEIIRLIELTHNATTATERVLANRLRTTMRQKTVLQGELDAAQGELALLTQRIAELKIKYQDN